MAVSQSDLCTLYLAYFGRPADPQGIAFYTPRVIGIVSPTVDTMTVLRNFEKSSLQEAVILEVLPEGEVIEIHEKGGGFLDEEKKDELRKLMASLVLTETLPTPSNLMEFVREISMPDFKILPLPRSGLACQAPGYNSPRLSAKALRREAMKPRGSKGR